MFTTAYDFKAFYNSREGRVVRRILQARILDIWSDCKNLQVLGCGYASPYARMFKETAAQMSLMMPAGFGAHSWPPDGPNTVFLSEASELPVETNSVDRVLMIHDLEFAEFSEPKLQEIWRILKSNGRLMIVVPNRAGFWARRDWSPFGHGRPYSIGQLRHHLRENLFVEECIKEALFMPPVRTGFVLKSAAAFEKIGQKIPVGAGVHIVEASKQLYARATPSAGSRVLVRGRGLMPKPATTSRTSHPRDLAKQD